MEIDNLSFFMGFTFLRAGKTTTTQVHRIEYQLWLWEKESREQRWGWPLACRLIISLTVLLLVDNTHY